MRIWDRFLTDRDRAVFAGSGWGKRAGFGERPVVLVVDVNYAFAGDRPEPIEESIKRWPNSCGAVAWEAAAHIRTVLDAAHPRGIPVIYSTSMDPRPHGWGAGRWADKHARLRQGPDSHRAVNNQIIEPIAPRPEDVVIQKEKPSAFFGSPLAAYLVDLQADSLLVCGTTTSGCVRATVIDAFSYNFRVAVIEEGTFDRGEASHAINLFDMDQKYADVVSVAETVEYLRGRPEGLFDARMPILRNRHELAAAGRR
jgi:maleamate amidohydrolase